MVRRLSLDLRGVVVVVSSRLESPFVEAGSRSVFIVFPRALGSQVGGRLWGFLPAWEEITYDAFVLSVVREGFFISILWNLFLMASSGAALRPCPLFFRNTFRPN